MRATGTFAVARRLAFAVAGALGFLTRLPVGHDDEAWTAFTEHPWAAVVPGYVVGIVTACVLAGALLGTPWVPTATIAFGFVLVVYALVGINNLDGVADCGDAMVVHGDATRRRAVLADTTTGVGAIGAVAVVVVGLALGAIAVSMTGPVAALAIVIGAEVGARTGTAGLAGVARAPHDGLGRSLTAGSGIGTLVVALVLAFPAVVWPIAVELAVTDGLDSAGAVGFGAAGAIGGAIGATVIVGWWAHARLGGANGDVFGAASELARVVGLHVGVIAWTLS